MLQMWRVIVFTLLQVTLGQLVLIIVCNWNFIFCNVCACYSTTVADVKGYHVQNCGIIITVIASVQSNLAKGRITDLSPLIGFVRYRPPSNTWFLGSTRVSPTNGISIGSAVFAQLSRVTNTETQTSLRTISVATGRICALHADDAV